MFYEESKEGAPCAGGDVRRPVGGVSDGPLWLEAGRFSCLSECRIESVEVSAHTVQITGFYPGSFPEGFCGYYAEEQDGKLYVGFRFSAVFGFSETGDFTVTIPVKGEIREVILKTGSGESTIWSRE